MVHNKLHTDCSLSKKLLLVSLSLLAVILVLLTIVYLYNKCFKKKQEQETDKSSIIKSETKTENKYDNISNVENDVYVEAESVKIYRIGYNKSIMHEKEQSEIERNKTLRPSYSYVEL